MRLRLITWNVHKGRGPLGVRTDFAQVASALARTDAGIVCCQEVLHPRGLTPQDRMIAAALGHHHRFTGHARCRHGVHGLATTSAWPISRHVHTDISTNVLEKRAVQHVRVHPRVNETLHVFNVHFGLTRRQRAQQAERLAEMITCCVKPGEPFVAMGDFNDWTRSVERHLTATLGAHNALARLRARERRTFPGVRPVLALDRIYYRGLTLVEAAVLHGRPWSSLSDHCPVKAVFEWAPRH